MEKKVDLRVYKTKKALYDAFIELLEEEDFDSITVNELCDRAMVRRATFYNHFSDKFDFFASFVHYIRDEYVADSHDNGTGHSMENYYLVMLNNFITFTQKHEKLMHNLMKSNMLSKLIEITSKEIFLNLTKDIEKKNFHMSHVEPEVVASFYSGGLTEVIRIWLTNPGKMSEEQLVSSLKALFLKLYSPVDYLLKD